MIKVTHTPAIVAVFDDDDVLKGAIKKSNEKGYKILDCFTPFPVHGLERLLGIKYSNLGVAAFVFGCIGFSLAMTLLTYTMTLDWPEDIGGKPTWPLASFIPILFEMTVLICSLGMAFTYYWICGLFPGVEPVIYDQRATSDRFVLILEEGAQGDDIKNTMQQSGVVDIRNDFYITHNFPGPAFINLK